MASTDKSKVKITETSKQANVDITSETITLPIDSADHTLVAKVPSAANCTSGVNVEVEMSPDGVNWCPALRKETVTTPGSTTAQIIGNEKYVDLQKNAPVYNSYAKGGLNFDVNGNEVSLGTGARDLLDQHIAVNKSFNHSMWINSNTLPTSTYKPVLFRHGGYDNFENTKVVQLQDNDPSGTPIENKFKNGATFAKGAAGATFNETYYNSTSSWTHAFWVKGKGANTGSDWGLDGPVNQWFTNYVRIQAGVVFDYSAQRLAFTWLGAGLNSGNVIYSGTVTGSSTLHPGETNDEFCSQWFLCVATHDYDSTTGTQTFNQYMYTEDGRSWAGGTYSATRTSTAVTYNGRTIDGNGGSGGDVCQYFIWDKALSSSEVSDLLRTSPLGGNNKCPEDPTSLSTASNLIGWYTFGDDPSDTATSINNAAPGSSIPDLVTSGNTYVAIPNTESVYMNGPIRSTQNLCTVNKNEYATKVQHQVYAGTTNTINVTVANNGTSNKFYLDGVSSTGYIDLAEGATYVFDQSDSSNAGHPLRFSTTSNGTHGGGNEYTTGVTTIGTPGQAGAYTQIVVTSSAPDLYYYCTQHSGMGGFVRTRAVLAIPGLKISNASGTFINPFKKSTDTNPNTLPNVSNSTFNTSTTNGITISGNIKVVGTVGTNYNPKRLWTVFLSDSNGNPKGYITTYFSRVNQYFFNAYFDENGNQLAYYGRVSTGASGVLTGDWVHLTCNFIKKPAGSAHQQAFYSRMSINGDAPAQGSGSANGAFQDYDGLVVRSVELGGGTDYELDIEYDNICFYTGWLNTNNNWTNIYNARKEPLTFSSPNMELKSCFTMGDGDDDKSNHIYKDIVEPASGRQFVKYNSLSTPLSVALTSSDDPYSPILANKMPTVFSTGIASSISGWFKTTATGTLFSNRDSSQGLKVEVTNSGITVTHNSTTVNYNNVGSVKDGQWHHFCLRKYANNIYNLLIDNVGAGSTYQLAQANTDWQGSNGFTLLSDGNNNATNTNPFATDNSKLNAELSNWSLHTEALSDQAITQLYSNGHVRNIKNLPSVDANAIVAWWQLNDATNPQNDLVSSNHLQLIDKGIAKDKALKTVGDGTNPTANSFEITGTNKNPWAEASSNTTLSLDPDTNNNAQGGLGVTMQIKCEAGVTASSNFSRKNLLYVKLTNGKFMEMFLEKNTSSNDLVFVLFMSDTASVSSSNSSGALAIFSAGTGLDDGNWHHLSVNITDDSSDLFNATRIYLDGSLVTQTSHPWSGYTNQSFTGVVDEVVILGNAGANSSGNNLDMDITIDNLGFFTGYYHNNHFTSTAAAVLYDNRNDLSYPTLDSAFSSDQPVMTAIFEMGDRNGDVTSPNSAISLKDEILPTYRAITPQSSLHADSGVVTLLSTEDPYSGAGGATNTDLSTKLVNATGPTLIEKSINGNAMTLSLTKNFNFTTSKWVSDASGDAALCLSLNGFEEQAEYFALWKCSQTLPDGAVDICDGNWHNIALSYRGQNDLAGNNVAEGDAVRFGRGSSDNPFNWSLAIDGYPIYTEITNNTGADYIGGLNTLLTDTINNVTYNVGFNIYNRHLKYDPSNTEEEYRVHGQFGSGVHTYLTNETDPNSFRGEVDETSFHTDPWWSNADGTNIDVFGSDTSKRGNLFNQEKTYTLYGRTTALAHRGAAAKYPTGVPYPLLNPELLITSGNISDIEGTNQFLNPVRKGDTQSWNSQASAGGLEGWWRWGDTPGDCSITVNDVKDHNATPAVDYRDIDAVYLTDQGTSSNVVLATNESIFLQGQAASTTQGSAGTQFNQIKLEDLSSLIGSAACTVKDFVSPVLQYLRIKLTGSGTCDIGEGKLEIEVNHKKRRMK